MKRPLFHQSRWLVGGILVGGLVGFFSRAAFNGRAVVIDRSAPSPAPSSAPATDTRPSPSAAGAATTERFRQVIADPHGWLRAHVTPESLEPYLERHHLDAESLLAVYDITGEARLLVEALKNHPNDPSVLMVAFGKISDTDTETFSRTDLARRLSEAAPNNALGPLVLAGELSQNGQTEELQSLIAQTLNPGGFDLMIPSRLNAMQEALTSTGVDCTTASLLSSNLVSLPIFNAIQAAAKAGATLAKQQLADGRRDDAIATANSLVALGDLIGEEPGQIYLSYVVGSMIRGDGYRAFPPDATFGDTGKTGAELYAEGRANLRADAYFQASHRIDALLQQLDPAGIDSYLRRQKLVGDRTAVQWLLERTSQPPP